MVTWQSVAHWFAIGLALFGVLLLLTMGRRFDRVVLLLLSVPIPGAGFLYFSLNPGPQPQLTWLTWLASSLIVIGVFPAFYSVRLRQAMRPGKTVTLPMLIINNRYALAARGCVVVGLSAYVAMFEPVFGIANLVACGIWVALWIPRRWRLMQVEVVAPVGARPARTYGYVSEASNWPRYQADVQEVRVRPEGRLHVGSEVTVRRLYPFPVARSIESTFVVAAMVPDVSLTLTGTARGDVTNIEVRPSGAGSTVTIRSHGVVSRIDAILGLKPAMSAQLAERRKAGVENLTRLDELLSTPAGAP
jgi:hypothetical protein